MGGLNSETNHHLGITFNQPVSGFKSYFLDGLKVNLFYTWSTSGEEMYNPDHSFQHQNGLNSGVVLILADGLNSWVKGKNVGITLVNHHDHYDNVYRKWPGR